MKFSTATAILAVATLGVPVAVGQSQGISTIAIQPVTPAPAALEPAASSIPSGPDSVASWLMAFAFLVAVVVRRMGPSGP